MDNNVLVCIPIETGVRELDGKLLLAMHLLKDGFSVMIGSRNGINREISYMQNAIYYAKSVSKEQSKFFSELKNNGNKVVVQNVEGGVLYKDEKSHFNAAYPNEIIGYLDGVFLFGESLRKSFLENIKNFDSSKLIVSGDSRFDLLKPKYRPFYQEKVNRLIAKYGDFIQINTSFSIANPFVGEEKLFSFMEKSNGYSKSTIENLRYKNGYFKNVMQKFIEAIDVLATKFPDKNFIIRPHPSESLINYQNYFKKFPNVYVNNKGNVQEWILASKAVIHYDCTTGIESILANKPTIAFVPQKDDAIFAWLPSYVSNTVKTIGELTNQISNVFNKEFISAFDNEKKKVLNGYLANVSGESSPVISKYLQELITHETKFAKGTGLFIQRAKSTIKVLKSNLSKKERYSISTKKFKGIERGEIKGKIELLLEIEGYKVPYSLNVYGKNVVLLRPKK